MKLFSGPRDDVGDGLSILLPSEDLFASGQNRLVPRQLRASLAAILGQLVGDIQCRSIVRDAHAGADSEAIDRRARVEELRNLVFVQAAAGENASLLKAGGIEHAASNAASMPWVRRAPKSTTVLLRAAAATRAPFEARTVCT